MEQIGTAIMAALLVPSSFSSFKRSLESASGSKGGDGERGGGDNGGRDGDGGGVEDPLGANVGWSIASNSTLSTEDAFFGPSKTSSSSEPIVTTCSDWLVT